ncbi:hypothetical protein EC988_007580 [Linderina pennispora]|nr:hypothetical protein EC988_007580 [Linderina pennispora]
MPYAQLDLTRVTAVQTMNTATDCGQCIKVCNADDSSKFVYVLAIDTGGKGLDLTKPAFGKLFNIDDGIGPATWSPVDNKHCEGIWNNGGTITGAYDGSRVPAPQEPVDEKPAESSPVSSAPAPAPAPSSSAAAAATPSIAALMANVQERSTTSEQPAPVPKEAVTSSAPEPQPEPETTTTSTTSSVAAAVVEPQSQPEETTSQASSIDSDELYDIAHHANGTQSSASSAQTTQSNGAGSLAALGSSVMAALVVVSSCLLLA